MAQASWEVLVDWNSDDDFGDDDEDISADVRAISYRYMRDLATEHMPPAELTVVLNNEDHKYSPPNSSSDLTGLLLPGKTIRLRAEYPSSTFTNIFTGFITAIQPRPAQGDCVITARDAMDRMSRITLWNYSESSPPYDTEGIFADVLDDAGEDGSGATKDSCGYLITENWMPPYWDISARQTLRTLQEEEDGFIWIDGSGVWRLEARDHRDSDTSQATIKDTNDASNPYFSELEWQDPADFIENIIYMRVVSDWTNNGTNVYWTLGEVVHFDADEVKEFITEITPRLYNLIVGTVTLVENTDYEANTQDDGGGSDISSEITVAKDETKYKGNGVLITVTWGETEGYLTLLQARSLNTISFDEYSIIRAEDSDSIDAYGERTHVIRPIWTREAEIAQATVDNRLARKKNPKTVLKLEVPASSVAANVALMLQPISEKVTVSYSAMGISEDFFIEGKAIEVTKGGAIANLTLLLRED